MPPIIDQIRTERPEQRQQFIIDALQTYYGDLIRAAPAAWRGRFRKMAATPYSFYRGSVGLFYADLSRDDPDPFTRCAAVVASAEARVAVALVIDPAGNRAQAFGGDS